MQDLGPTLRSRPAARRPVAAARPGHGLATFWRDLAIIVAAIAALVILLRWTVAGAGALFGA